MQLVDAQKYLPPEVLLDEYHPANTTFFKNIRQLEQALVAASQAAGSATTTVAKMNLRGVTNADIADELGFKREKVARLLRSPEGKKLKTLLYYLQHLREGPNIEQRKRTLWEIAAKNQEEDPKTSISAIQEMNRMDGVGKEKIDQNINVTINNQLLPKGALDG